MVAQTAHRKVVLFATLGIALATITAGIVVWQTYDPERSRQLPVFPEPSPSPMGQYDRAAVSCDAPVCADIGKDVLLEGGTVVDAGIATLLCMGVIQTQSMGVGGGFLMVLYNATTRTSVALTAREKAPLLAFEDMFEGNPNISARGPLAVAVPGELKGYWEMYQRHGGGVPWSRLVQPTITLCEQGFNVSRHAANALAGQSERIKTTPSMAEIFINNATGEVWREGDRMRRPALARTLAAIAGDVDGGNLLYMDTLLMRNFVDDLRDLGGIMTYQDMLSYTTSWSDPLMTSLSNGYTHFTTPPPGSGLILSFILKLMDGFDLTPDVLTDFELSTLTYHRFVEAMKHAYAMRTFLGDPDPTVGDPDQVEQVEGLIRNLTSIDYINEIRSLILDHITNNTYEYYGAEFYMPENHGTSHLSIVGANGDAIAVTSTVNLHFGAAIRSRRTGIIYNDEMDDFSAPNITNSFGVPPSPNNFIMPGKRPVSSMAPSIFVDPTGRARLVIGAAGGTQITTSIAYATMRNIWLGQTIKEAIDAPRLHHQLYPMELKYESTFPQEYVAEFRAKNHTSVSMDPGSSIVVGVTRTENGTLFANSDFRKGGAIAGY
ncbi:scoloptoxin SSD14 isoform X3 [Folsomia candida]|uniref:scoloptoxin SSD14 isoform X3 n=1 Tax=Folsomia candida TaxID=158441 RepID=UPI000B8F1137|nr:scoloptoxin SSD14 isoform X3 [Folsomia candida]